MACPAPDPSLGTALRISSYLDCNADLLGREGFLALAGFGVSGGLLAGLLTISVALIGYRLVLGDELGLRDGASWVLRVGIVLALLAAWPAFQALFYGVTITAPSDIAYRLMSSLGLPQDAFLPRIQSAYDTLRLGIAVPLGGYEDDAQAALASAGAFQFQPPMPKTATTFLLTTSGLVAATRMAGAFLLAIAPFPIMALLFAPTYGLFVGWLRSLVTVIFAAIAFQVLSGLYLLAVEAEIGRIQGTVGIANAAAVDSQAIVAVIAVYTLIALALLLAVTRVAGAIASLALPFAGMSRQAKARNQEVAERDGRTPARLIPSADAVAGFHGGADLRSVRVADALREAQGRERGGMLMHSSGDRRDMTAQSSGASASKRGRDPHGQGRRALGRRHRSASLRDRTA